MRITLKRKPNDQQTPGNLSFDGFECFTLELPWKNNLRKVSCIRAGVYTWVKRAATTAIPYEHILLQNVPARDGVCIHSGNFATGAKPDTLGCVLVGSAYVDLNGDGTVEITNSKATFNKMMALLPNQGEIEII